jgi:SAM-dependent methyltransferase
MTLPTIPRDEVNFEPSSAVDPRGQVFWWRGKLFRAVPHVYAPFYRELCARAEIKELFGKALVAAEVAPLALEGFGLILEHKRVPFISYCVEWSFEMMRDAARLICNLSERLLRCGVVLQDAHPWNVLFDGGTPVFVDWGSLCPTGQVREWPAREFRERFLFPLWLLSARRSRIARLSMLDVVHALTRGEVARLIVGRVSPVAAMRMWLGDGQVREEPKPSAALFARLRASVDRIPRGSETTEWTEYEGPDTRFSHDSRNTWPAKLRSVYDVLQRLQPATVLDLGCNRGWFSELAARGGAQVVAADIDEPSVDTLYLRVRRRGLPILPLVMDVCSPTPAHGIGGAYPNAVGRLQCDLVLALALTHHLALKRALRFDQIASLLASFAKRWLLVEFVPREDVHLKDRVAPELTWYSEDGLRAALRPFFRRIQVLPSSPEPRVLLCCER